MTLTDQICIAITTPKPGPITTRLPGKFARTNAALIASVKKQEVVGGVKG